MANQTPRLSKVLITGATGFIGSHLALFLKQAGYHIRALTRQEVTSRLFEVNCIQGDLSDTQALRKAIRKCDYVIHCAAHVSYNEKDKDLIWKTNLEGTKNLISIARKADLKNFVFLSSAITRGIAKNDTTMLFEADAIRDHTGCSYIDSKIEAEKLIRNSGLPNWTIVYPTNTRLDVYIQKALTSKFIFCPTGGNNIIDVEDLAEGIICAMERGIRDEFILGGHNVTYAQIYHKILEVCERKAFIIKIHPRFKEFIKKRLANSEDTFMTPIVAEQSFGYKYYTSQRAFEHLHWQAKTDFTQTIGKGVLRYGRRQSK
jgi:dihydroflavonol-4-reductase